VRAMNSGEVWRRRPWDGDGWDGMRQLGDAREGDGWGNMAPGQRIAGCQVES
jgi:hypothetical protein